MKNRLCDNPDLFTIVMPIKDRPEYLKRSLDFLISQGFSGQVVIADGSSDDMSLENKQVIDNQKEIKIVYVYTAGVSKKMGWWIEMHQALKDIEYKYSLLYPDDDFFFLDEIDHCLDFLENNEDYVSARGRFVWGKRQYEKSSKRHQIQFAKMPMHSFTEPVVERRIVDMFNRYCHGFYDIVRRDVFLHAIDQLPKYFSKGAWFDQFACTILCGIHGKTHTSPRLYCVRQNHSGQKQKRESRVDPYQHWPMLLISPDFSDIYQSFRQCLINNCQEFVSVSEEELISIIDHGLIALIKRGFIRPPVEKQDEEILIQFQDSNSINHRRMRQAIHFLAPMLPEE